MILEKRMRILKWSIMIMFGVLVCVFGVLAGGIYADKTAAVIGSRNKTVTLYSLKGTIYDKQLLPLTNAKTCYYLLIDPRSFAASYKETICSLCAVEEQWLEQKLESESAFVITTTTRPERMQGVYIYEGVARYDGIAEHLIGYVNGELVGMSGLEKSYDTQLSYFGGSKAVSFSTDGKQNLMSGLGLTLKTDEGNYKNGVITTLDKGLQLALESAMDKYVDKGAAVILDVRSGEIRAMCSLPDFDADSIESYLNGKDGELINRALTEQTVGSVFKIVVAAAAIEQGIADFEKDCAGGIAVGDLEFTCPKEGGHGACSLQSAFAESCNVYFIALGQMLGTDTVMEMAERLGFGESMEIAEGLSASAGTLPDVTGAPAKQLANISIGQGDLMASPLQIARLMAVCANGGYLLSPTCFQGYYVDGEVRSEQWLETSERVLDAEVAEKLRQLCIATVQEGTGKAAAPEDGGAGGKTSSAQTGLFDENGKEILNTYFAGFYPAEQPQYALAVFAENGASGGATCAPVFKEVCDYICKEND